MNTLVGRIAASVAVLLLVRPVKLQQVLARVRQVLRPAVQLLGDRAAQLPAARLDGLERGLRRFRVGLGHDST